MKKIVLYTLLALGCAAGLLLVPLAHGAESSKPTVDSVARAKVQDAKTIRELIATLQTKTTALSEGQERLVEFITENVPEPTARSETIAGFFAVVDAATVYLRAAAEEIEGLKAAIDSFLGAVKEGYATSIGTLGAAIGELPRPAVEKAPTPAPKGITRRAGAFGEQFERKQRGTPTG